MANINLSRNTKVYYTSNIAADSGYDDSNTFEIQVMNGYSFSQKTEQQTIQINEAGATPNRGQRSFNTKLNPVDWSFGTYLRPQLITAAAAKTASEVTGTAGVATFTHASAHGYVNGDVVTIAGATPSGFNRTIPVNVSSTTVFTYPVATTATGTASGTITATKSARVTCVEKYLWNALVGTLDVYDLTNTTPAWVEAAGSATLSMTQSDAHTLAPFALVFKVDNTYYKVAGAACNQAEISFGLDAISMINWTGFGTTVAEVSDTAGLAELATVAGADTTANFITNKLSTLRLYAGLNSTAGAAYTLPITGGSLTVANNLTYLTPEILGTVNNTIGYFSGTRAVTGNLTAYLRTGAGNYAGQLLTDILATSATDPETKFDMIVEVGGGANATRVDFSLPAVMLQVPTIDIQDVVSTTINFTAQKSTGANFDLDATPNEMTVAYFSA